MAPNTGNAVTNKNNNVNKTISKQVSHSEAKVENKMSSNTIKATGVDLLRNPLLNKGTAFTQAERDEFKLNGYLPPKVETIDEQAARAYQIVSSKVTPVEKFDALMDIQDTNETLFFKVILNHLQEFAPIVYTPTIGQVCTDFSKIYRRPRGMWLTDSHRGRIAEILNTVDRDVKLIVVTDNERILGLGDLGAGGLGIPIGKLNLYTAGAGIAPECVLPISIDLGCNKQHILDSDHYLGENSKRLPFGEEAYDSYIEEFMVAVYARWPSVLLQFEDFWKTNAQGILDRYRHRFLSFNDDIQGTASVGVAGVFAAYKHLGKDIKDARLVMMGGGAAGIGITSLFEMALSRAGCEDPKSQIIVLDSQGLISHSRPGAFRNDPFKGQYAWTAEMVEKAFPGKSGERIHLEEICDVFKPSVLMGTSGTPGVFTETAIKNMAKHCDRPVIMPMSNPTRMCEAQPVDIVKWTDEKAIIATGSPFPAVELADGSMMKIGQGNNVFVFPGIGLGAILCRAKEVNDNMLYASAMALAKAVTQEDLDSGSCYPQIAKLREVTVTVTAEVMRQAVVDGLSEFKSDDYEEFVRQNMWKAEYKNYV